MPDSRAWPLASASCGPEGDAFDRGGHHHPGEAGPRFAHLQRLQGVAAGRAELLGQLREAGAPRCGDRVAPEVGAGDRIRQQLLDQPGGELLVARHGHLARARSSSGGATAASTGAASSAHSAAVRAQTTGPGATMASSGR
jgi:hypothetical protein